MNDLTKEELERILFSIRHGTPWGNEPIAHKIQSMIDNYPEPLPICAEDKHDWEFVDHGSAGYYKCLVCQRSYNEQTRKSE